MYFGKRSSRLRPHDAAYSSRAPSVERDDRYVDIDICELRLAVGKLNMFLAIDRVSKFTHVEFHESAGKMNGAAFLENVVKVFPKEQERSRAEIPRCPHL